MPTAQQTATYASLGVLIVICWIAVSARVYVRACLVKSFSKDDWLMVATLLLCTLETATAWHLVTMGMGEDDVVATREFLIWVFVAEPTYALATLTLKLSIAIQLLRFVASRRWRRLIIWTAGFYTAYGVIFSLACTFQCWPIASQWDHTIEGKCFISKTLFTAFIFVHAAVSLITDGVFSILPICLIWNLQMPRRTKISIGFVLGLGLTTAGVNIARFNFIGVINSPHELTFSFYALAITTVLEVAIGTIAASLATLRPLLKQISTKFFPHKSRKHPARMPELNFLDQGGVVHSLAEWHDESESSSSSSSSQDVEKGKGGSKPIVTVLMQPLSVTKPDEPTLDGDASLERRRGL